MKFHIYPTSDSATTNRIILLFAGWGMDEKPFADLSAGGYRLAVVWDYRDTAFPTELEKVLATVEEIVVMAWSFGVPAATRFILNHTELPITARIAINGTMHPVDDRLGIPEAIFNGTLEGLSEKSLSKFHLRMCGSSASFRDFSAKLPARTVSELREELEAIRDTAPLASLHRVWDRAIVSAADRIIPPANQTEAWSAEAVETISVEGAHLPDFPALFQTLLTEKGLVAEKFARAESTYDDNATAQREIAAKLLSLIPESLLTSSRPLSAIEIGCGTGLTTRMLLSKLPIGRLEAWDLHIPENFSPIDVRQAHVLNADDGFDCDLSTRECDAETEIRKIPSESIDIVFSASTMQWFNSPATFMRECARVLRPGGCAILSTFGPETMREINSLLHRRRHYPDMDTVGRMIPDGCRLLHFSSETHTLLFATPAEALRHVRLTGVNAVSRTASGATARTVLSAYPLTPSGEAPVTYQPIYVVFSKTPTAKTIIHPLNFPPTQ